MRQQGENGSGSRAGERFGSRYDVHDAQEFDLQPLSELKFKLLGSTAADLHEAENAVWDLNQRTAVLESRVLADAMLNIEAMASVRMDGRQPSARTLFFDMVGASLGARELTDAAIRYQRDRASLEHTLSMWKSVRRGEERWIFPYQENADAIMNTTLVYELAVIKKHIFPMLMTVRHGSPYFEEVQSIIKFLNYVLEANVDDEIPPTSVLREFIGGNAFYR